MNIQSNYSYILDYSYYCMQMIQACLATHNQTFNTSVALFRHTVKTLVILKLNDCI